MPVGLPAEALDIAIVGGGPAGLMAAETLSARSCLVTVYDRMPTVGRKLLMAGRGGLNLTHSEPFERFRARYGAASQALRACLDGFPPEALIAWAEDLGQPTFVGSSGRVFPKTMKASPLLRAWVARLTNQGVRFHTGADWLGWDASDALVFRTGPALRPDAVILALGGATWPRLGSNGAWASLLAARGVPIVPFRPANCGFVVGWSEVFRERFAGAPLKPVALTFGGRTVRGEALIADYGIEGGGVYALSASVREAIGREGRAVLELDLRPDSTEEQLATRLSRPRAGQSASNFLRKTVGLSPVAVNLLREVNGGVLPENLPYAIKHTSIVLTGTQGLARAISSAGGVSWTGVDEGLMLRSVPGVFVAGEMLDWEAPTGGYLLQACFATGFAAALGVLRRLT